MQRHRYAKSRIIALVITVLLVSCSESGPGPVDTPQFGTLVGTVRGPDAQGVAGATVTLGTVSTTTSVNGGFELRNVAVGAGTITVNANGFDSYTQSVTVQAGTNTHDVALVRATFYAHGVVTAFLSPTIATYRGVIYLLAGSTQDSRPFIRGEPLCWASQGPLGICPMIADFRVGLLAMAEKHGLAVFGMKTPPANELAAYDTMIAAMVDISQRSGHPELAAAPVLLVGSSLGGCIAHGFARVYFARAIGFVTAKGSCHIGGPSPASGVPGYLFVSDEDPVSPDAITTITQLFLANRAEGAVWALAIDVGSGHEFPEENSETLTWLDAILTRRLPAGHVPGMALAAVGETTGWLANRTSTEIAPHACFTGDALIASWLPNEQTARGWQAIVGSSGMVSPCP